MNSDFDKYKTDIDLIVFAGQVYGYQVNKKKSTRSEVVVQDLEQTQTLIISRNRSNGHFTYFNPQNEKDRGTIIDFSLYRNQGDWKKVRAELNSYAQGIPNSLPLPNPATEPQAQFDILPLTDRSYLHGRGITDATLDHPFFTNRIFNQAFVGEGGKNYLNTVFPLYRQEKIVGLEVKNIGYHGNAKGSERANACWMSNLPEWEPGFWSIITTESAIDALSYHQLFPPDAQDRRIYVSMGGYIAIGQRKLFQELVANYSPNRIILGNDNDAPGVLHNINLIGWMETHLERSKLLKASAYLPESDTVSLLIEVQSGAMQEIWVAAVKKMFEAHSDASGIPFSVHTLDRNEERVRIEVKGASHRENLEAIERYLIYLKGLQDQVSIARAQQKDFNEDLTRM